MITQPLCLTPRVWLGVSATISEYANRLLQTTLLSQPHNTGDKNVNRKKYERFYSYGAYASGESEQEHELHQHRYTNNFSGF